MHEHALRWAAGWRLAGYVLVGVVVWLSLAPRPPALDVEHGDKLQHVAAYATLMWWFAQVHAGRARGGAALALVGLGIALEGAQGLTGYRSLDAIDMAANAAGVLVGMAVSPPRSPNVLRFLERLVR